MPLRLWAYCGKFHCEDGRLAGYSEQEIESIAAWWGKSGLMVPAMEKAELMAKDDSGWLMLAWNEHQGHLAAFKAKGKAMAEARWNAARNAASIATKPPKQCLNQPTDPTVPTDPIQLSKKGFQKPTFPEMELHAQKIGLQATEINRFFNYYEANGWRVGRNPMKSWQAAMVNWRTHASEYGTRNKPSKENEYEAENRARAERTRRLLG